MRKEFPPKPWFVPLPVLMIGTYDEKGTPDVMNAAWGGLYDSDEVVLCLSPSHKTTKNILHQKEFTVSFAGKSAVLQADLAGLISANQYENKVEEIGLHAVKAQSVNAPVFEEFPLSLECVFENITEDGNIIGKIKSISAEETVLGENGLPQLQKLHPISYDPISGMYLQLGSAVGKAFSCGKELCEEAEQ